MNPQRRKPLKKRTNRRSFNPRYVRRWIRAFLESEMAGDDSAPAPDSATCSDFVLSVFPRPCIPRNKHRCHLCWQTIDAGEACCRSTGLEPGAGYWTAHMHPECFDLTRRWDEGDWESHMLGDVERPGVRMVWSQN